MTPITVIIIVAAYFGLLIFVSWLSARGSGSDSNTTFFTGGRRAPWLLVAFATIGASISGVTFISVPGMVAAKGWSYLQMVAGFIVGYAVIAFLLVPLLYKRNLLSIYAWLGERFGSSTYQSGAWMFLISKMLGASVRFFVVCAVLQVLVFEPLGIPFAVNVVATIALIWLYTARTGVKAVLATDLLKSACLIGSVVACIVVVAKELSLSGGDIASTIWQSPQSRMLWLDDPYSPLYFWKQFVAGIFMAIATNGLDQDMMQRNMACRDSASARKNMLLSGVMQFFVVALFLALGVLLTSYCAHAGIAMPEKSDELFSIVATAPAMPAIVGVLFVVGLISAAYSAAGSALTSLTTSMTVDIVRAPERFSEKGVERCRKMVHMGMSLSMGLVIIAFYYAASSDAISAVYTLASYTYGPILGMFAFGICSRRAVIDRALPAICLAAPALSWVSQWYLATHYDYHTGFELLLINALFTALLMGATSLVKELSYVKKSA